MRMIGLSRVVVVLLVVVPLTERRGTRLVRDKHDGAVTRVEVILHIMAVRDVALVDDRIIGGASDAICGDDEQTQHYSAERQQQANHVTSGQQTSGGSGGES